MVAAPEMDTQAISELMEICDKEEDFVRDHMLRLMKEKPEIAFQMFMAVSGLADFRLDRLRQILQQSSFGTLAITAFYMREIVELQTIISSAQASLNRKENENESS
jgi:peptide subunit release factor 1 (eRF1)